MARQSRVAMAAVGAMQNLVCIHDLALEAETLGERRSVVYLRNAGDCARWCAALRTAGVAYPPFMYAGGLPYFSRMWRV
jgi:hypothetical protein